MADYQTIDADIWTDPWFIDLPDHNHRLFFIFLCANKFKNTTGIYEIHPKVLADLSGFSRAKCKKMLEKFQKDDKVYYESGFIILKNRQKHTTFNNESVRGFVVNHINNVIPTAIKDNHMDIINDLLEKACVFEVRESRTKTPVNHLNRKEKGKERIDIYTSEAEPPEVQSIRSEIQRIEKLAGSCIKSTLTTEQIEGLIKDYTHALALTMTTIYYSWKGQTTQKIKSDNLAIRKPWVEQKAREQLSQEQPATPNAKPADLPAEWDNWTQDQRRAYNLKKAAGDK